MRPREKNSTREHSALFERTVEDEPAHQREGGRERSPFASGGEKEGEKKVTLSKSI
jgi:hypothetical protein